MHQLHILNLNNNHLNELTSDVTSSAPNLQSLDVSHNVLEELQSSLFSHKELRILNIADNRISKLDGELFEHIPLLEVLDFQDNYVSFFPNFTSKCFRHLRKIVMDQNPWQCSCMLDAAAKFSKFPHSISSSGIYCTSYLYSLPCEKN